MRFLFLALFVLVLVEARAESPPSDLSVLTFNIRYGTAKDEGHSWEVRKNAVAEVLREHNPDLAGLQEALDFQVEFLRNRFKGTYIVVGEGREGGTDGEFSPLFIRSGRFELAKAGRFWLSDTPDVIGSKSWASLPRIVTWAELYDRPAQKRLLVLNTHWAHDSEEARLKSAKLILEKVGEIAGAGTSVLLVGDFNCVPDSEPHRVLVGGGADTFEDSVSLEKERPKSTFHGFRGERRDGGPIDWILFRNELQAKEYRVLDGEYLGELPSDHFPVLAKFAW